MADPRPIGMFDSGFGGLTVARAVIDLLPDEQLVYLGDTARYPYGPRPLDEVRRFSFEIAEHLVDQVGVKALVVACNTASAAALDDLATRYDVPVVGVIEPGARAAVSVTRNGRVGVIGTVGTIESGAYQHAIATIDPDVEVVATACPGFVEFVERGEIGSHQVHVLAERLLAPVQDAEVDTLLLGCTHYPFLARTIGDVMGREVVLVSSADETAFELRGLLSGSAAAQEPSGRRPEPVFLTTGDAKWFTDQGARLLGPELEAARTVCLDQGAGGSAVGGGEGGPGAEVGVGG